MFNFPFLSYVEPNKSLRCTTQRQKDRQKLSLQLLVRLFAVSTCTARCPPTSLTLGLPPKLREDVRRYSASLPGAVVVSGWDGSKLPTHLLTIANLVGFLVRMHSILIVRCAAGVRGRKR